MDGDAVTNNVNVNPPQANGKLVIAVAAGAFTDRDRLVAHIGPRAELRFCDVSSPAAIAEATKDALGIVVSLQRLHREEIESLSDTVKVIGRAGVGLDSIDLAAAEAAGISVLNEPAYGANEVASHALALLLALQRRITDCDRYVREGWSGGLTLGAMQPLDEMELGLVGCGRIGSALASMARGVFARVRAFDPLAESLPEGLERVESLAELLAMSDVVSLHTPLTEETTHLINEERLAQMRPGSFLVNVSRGPVIDEGALARALESGRIGGAALDVFEAEPLASESPLLHAPNTMFSPHVAAYSLRAAWRLASWTVEDTVAWIEGKAIPHGNLVVRGSR